MKGYIVLITILLLAFLGLTTFLSYRSQAVLTSFREREREESHVTQLRDYILTTTDTISRMDRQKLNPSLPDETTFRDYLTQEAAGTVSIQELTNIKQESNKELTASLQVSAPSEEIMLAFLKQLETGPYFLNFSALTLSGLTSETITLKGTLKVVTP